MQRKFVDTSIIQSRNMEKDGNVDYQYWHDKSIEERLRAAGEMIKVAYNEPDFFTKRLDKTIISARKHSG